MNKIFLYTFFILFFVIYRDSYAQEKLLVLPFDVKSQEFSSIDKSIVSSSFSEIISECQSVNNKVLVIDSGSFEKFANNNSIKNSNDIFDTKYYSFANTIIKGFYEEKNGIHKVNVVILNNKTKDNMLSIDLVDTNFFSLNKSICNSINKFYKIQLNTVQKKYLSELFDKNNNYQSYFSFTEGKKFYYKLSYNDLKKSAVFFSDSFNNNQKFILSRAYRVEVDTLINFFYFLENEKVNYLLEANTDSLSLIYSNKELLPIYRISSLLEFMKGNYLKSLSESKKGFDISSNDLLLNYLFTLNKAYKNKLVKNKILDSEINKNNYYLLPILTKAYILYKNKDKELEKFLYKIIEIDSSSTISYNYLGRLYYDKRDNNKASEMFSKSLSLDSENPISYFKVGELFQLNGNYQQSSKYFKDAIYRLPESDNFKFSLGVSYHSQSLIKDALEQYNEAIKLNPYEDKYYSAISQIYYNKEMYDDALYYAKKSININRNSSYSHVNLAMIYNKLSKKEDAIKEINEALKLNNKYSYAYYNLGIFYKDLKNYDESIKAFKNAIKNDYNYLLAYYKLGEIYKEKGLLDDALKSFTRTIQIDPTYINSYNEIANIKKSQKKYNEAIFNYKETLKINPKHKNTILELSNLYFKLGIDFYSNNKILGAIKYYEESIRLKPDNAMVYNNLGVAYFSINKYDEAIIQFKKACLLDSNYSDAYDNLGIVYDKLGNSEISLKNYKKACDLGKLESCDIVKSKSSF